jgi:hypothetical protein
MRLQLIKNRLLKISKETNAHRLSMKSMVSFPTVAKYVHNPEKSNLIDLNSLTAVLINGCGMTKEQILQTRIGDLFEFSEGGGEDGKA